MARCFSIWFREKAARRALQYPKNFQSLFGTLENSELLRNRVFRPSARFKAQANLGKVGVVSSAAHFLSSACCGKEH